MLRKLGVLVASLTLVLVPSVALVLLPASSAAAGKIDGDGTANPPDNNGGGGGGGGYDPDPTVYRYYFHGDEGCAPEGDKESYSYTIISRVVTKAEYDLARSQGKSGSSYTGEYLIYVGLDCHWLYTTHRPVSCADSVSITATGPMSDPAIIYGPTTKKSDWAQTLASQKDPDLCEESVTFAASVRLPKLGRYRMDVLVGLRPCMRYDFIGGTRPAEIRDCQEPNFVPRLFKAQQWCDGFSKNWNDTPPHTFTMEECTQTNPTMVKCNVPEVRLDRSTGYHGILDDGMRHKAVWEGTSLSGTAVVNKVFLVDTKVVVDREGEHPSTPFREGKSQDASTQPFQGVPPVGGRAGDLRTMEGLQWHSPSIAGQPWILDRTVSAKSLFKITSTKIVSIPLTSDDFVPVTEPFDTFFSDTVDCPSKSLTVTVNRARNYR